MDAENYIYNQLEHSDTYRAKLIEFLRHQTNVEVGGYRLYDGTGTHYMQNAVEVTDVLLELKKLEKTYHKKIDSFLEVGFSAGINTTVFHKFFNFSNIVAVDWLSGEGINKNTFYANLRFKDLILVCGDSRDKKVIKKVKMFGKYDLIFIDGGHDYEVVKADFYNYRPFLNVGGVIVFHDIAASNIPGPGKLWNELKSTFDTGDWEFKEFVDKGNFITYGLGMMRWTQDCHSHAK